MGALLFLWLIQNFSTIVAPLTTLTNPTSLFWWSRKGQEAFEQLKWCLTSSPVLQLLNPNILFIVEGDASDVGVGVVLSQHSGNDQNPHPCTYFSHHLVPSEWNYDVGNNSSGQELF